MSGAQQIWWPEPAAGDIVWCMFPYLPDLAPGRKPRPVLVIKMFDDEAPEYGVMVAYGTSQKIHRLLAGEFALCKQTDSAAYRLAGLSYDTKFSFNQTFVLPFNDIWFNPPPNAAFGNTPKLGVLHPAVTTRAAKAWKASTP